MMTFRDKALILNEQENWKLFSQTEEIAQEIKTGLNELREEIKANFEAKKRKRKRLKKTSVISAMSQTT